MGSSTIERLAHDRRSGSAAIVRTAAHELARIAEQRSRDELRDACQLLLDAHPS
ncbi:MAG: hypothetical protein HY465_02980, partial [Deltaproteobacteria bacterium]|nr:hypothetical protein [Deltaproteobacteria bacterium]